MMVYEKNRLPQISEGELEVMKVLWRQGEAMTSSQIIEQLTGETQWKAKTIQTMLNRLVIKAAVSVDKTNSRNYRYQPLVEEEIYKLKASEHFLDKLYDGSVNLLVANFVKEKKLSEQQKAELRSLLEEE